MSCLWRDKLRSEGLSQGDIIAKIPFGVPFIPVTQLKKVTCKGDRIHWEGGDKTTDHFLYRGMMLMSIVLTHSCELDKRSGQKAKVISAPIRLLSELDKEARDSIVDRQRIALVPLEQIPMIGDCYADLRMMSSTTRTLISDNQRIVSMDDHGVELLQSHLINFFVNRNVGLDDVKAAIS